MWLWRNISWYLGRRRGWWRPTSLRLLKYFTIKHCSKYLSGCPSGRGMEDGCTPGLSRLSQVCYYALLTTVLTAYRILGHNALQWGQSTRSRWRRNRFQSHQKSYVGGSRLVSDLVYFWRILMVSCINSHSDLFLKSILIYRSHLMFLWCKFQWTLGFFHDPLFLFKVNFVDV